MSDFVLVEAVAQRKGRTLYYARMTGIGPMTTPSLEKAAKYANEEAAKRSPAFAFPLTVFQPIASSESASGGGTEKPR